MQTLQLLSVRPIDIDERDYLRAAIRECLAYNEHGIDTEYVNGQQVCFNCGGHL